MISTHKKQYVRLAADNSRKRWRIFVKKQGEIFAMDKIYEDEQWFAENEAINNWQWKVNPRRP